MKWPISVIFPCKPHSLRVHLYTMLCTKLCYMCINSNDVSYLTSMCPIWSTCIIYHPKITGIKSVLPDVHFHQYVNTIFHISWRKNVLCSWLLQSNYSKGLDVSLKSTVKFLYQAREAKTWTNDHWFQRKRKIPVHFRTF